MKAFNQIKYGTYEKTEQAVTLRSSGGDYGGGSEVLVIQRRLSTDDNTVKVKEHNASCRR